MLTEQLLISTDGSLVQSPLVIDVQIRRFPSHTPGVAEDVAVEEFELSRQRLREDPATGGLVSESEDFPAYLPAGGTDYRFASPALDAREPRLPILGTLASRCASHHGTWVGAILTFSQHFPERIPPVRVLPPSKDLHAAFVSQQKRERGEFKALLESW